MTLKTLPAISLKLNIGGLVYQEYIAEVPPGTEYEDLFNPIFWSHYKGKLIKGDVMRLIEQEGGFDVMLTVVELTDNGDVLVGAFPRVPGTKSAVQRQPTEVPLSKSDGMPLARVEFNEATKWRVRGYDGQEVSKNHSNKAVALKAFDRYLADMNLVLPSEDVIAKAVADIEAKKAKSVSKEKAA